MLLRSHKIYENEKFLAADGMMLERDLTRRLRKVRGERERERMKTERHTDCSMRPKKLRVRYKSEEKRK